MAPWSDDLGLTSTADAYWISEEDYSSAVPGPDDPGFIGPSPSELIQGPLPSELIQGPLPSDGGVTNFTENPDLQYWIDLYYQQQGGDSGDTGQPASMEPAGGGGGSTTYDELVVSDDIRQAVDTARGAVGELYGPQAEAGNQAEGQGNETDIAFGRALAQAEQQATFEAVVARSGESLATIQQRHVIEETRKVLVELYGEEAAKIITEVQSGERAEREKLTGKPLLSEEEYNYLVSVNYVGVNGQPTLDQAVFNQTVSGRALVGIQQELDERGYYRTADQEYAKLTIPEHQWNEATGSANVSSNPIATAVDNLTLGAGAVITWIKSYPAALLQGRQLTMAEFEAAVQQNGQGVRDFVKGLIGHDITKGLLGIVSEVTIHHPLMEMAGRGFSTGVRPALERLDHATPPESVAQTARYSQDYNPITHFFEFLAERIGGDAAREAVQESLFPVTGSKTANALEVLNVGGRIGLGIIGDTLSWLQEKADWRDGTREHSQYGAGFDYVHGMTFQEVVVLNLLGYSSLDENAQSRGLDRLRAGVSSEDLFKDRPWGSDLIITGIGDPTNFLGAGIIKKIPLVGKLVQSTPDAAATAKRLLEPVTGDLFRAGDELVKPGLIHERMAPLIRWTEDVPMPDNMRSVIRGIANGSGLVQHRVSLAAQAIQEAELALRAVVRTGVKSVDEAIDLLKSAHGDDLDVFKAVLGDTPMGSLADSRAGRRLFDLATDVDVDDLVRIVDTGRLPNFGAHLTEAEQVAYIIPKFVARLEDVAKARYGLAEGNGRLYSWAQKWVKVHSTLLLGNPGYVVRNFMGNIIPMAITGSLDPQTILGIGRKAVDSKFGLLEVPGGYAGDVARFASKLRAGDGDFAKQLDTVAELMRREGNTDPDILKMAARTGLAVGTAGFTEVSDKILQFSGWIEKSSRRTAQFAGRSKAVKFWSRVREAGAAAIPENGGFAHVDDLMPGWQQSVGPEFGAQFDAARMAWSENAIDTTVDAAISGLPTTAIDPKAAASMFPNMIAPYDTYGLGPNAQAMVRQVAEDNFTLHRVPSQGAERVWHGTASAEQFEELAIRGERPIFVSPSRDYAEHYSRGLLGGAEGRTGAARVIEVYIEPGAHTVDIMSLSQADQLRLVKTSTTDADILSWMRANNIDVLRFGDDEIAISNPAVLRYSQEPNLGSLTDSYKQLQANHLHAANEMRQESGLHTTPHRIGVVLSRIDADRTVVDTVGQLRASHDLQMMRLGESIKMAGVVNADTLMRKLQELGDGRYWVTSHPTVDVSDVSTGALDALQKDFEVALKRAGLSDTTAVSLANEIVQGSAGANSYQYHFAQMLSNWEETARRGGAVVPDFADIINRMPTAGKWGDSVEKQFGDVGLGYHTVGSLPRASGLAEIAEAQETMWYLDRLMDGMRANGQSVVDELSAIRLPPGADVVDLLNKVRQTGYGEIRAGRAIAEFHGEVLADLALHNYDKFYNLDLFLKFVMPYEFWLSRSAVKWATNYLPNNPWMISQIGLRLRENLPELSERLEAALLGEDWDDRMSAIQGRIERIKATLPPGYDHYLKIPIPMIGAILRMLGGGKQERWWSSMVFDPLNPNLLPYMNLLDGFDNRELIASRGQAFNDAISSLPSLSLPISIAMNMAGWYGVDARQQPLPRTNLEKLMRSLTALPVVRDTFNSLPIRYNIPYTGIEWREIAPVTTFVLTPDQFHDPKYGRFVERELLNMVESGLISEAQLPDLYKQMQDVMNGTLQPSGRLAEAFNHANWVYLARSGGSNFLGMSIQLQSKNQDEFFARREELSTIMHTATSAEEIDVWWQERGQHYVTGELRDMLASGDYDGARLYINRGLVYDEINTLNEERRAAYRGMPFSFADYEKQEDYFRFREKQIYEAYGFDPATFYDYLPDKRRQDYDEKINNLRQLFENPNDYTPAARERIINEFRLTEERMLVDPIIGLYYTIPDAYRDAQTGWIDWKYAMAAQEQWLGTQYWPHQILNTYVANPKTAEQAVYEAWKTYMFDEYGKYRDQGYDHAAALRLVATGKGTLQEFITAEAQQRSIDRVVGPDGIIEKVVFSDEQIAAAVAEFLRANPDLQVYMDWNTQNKIDEMIAGTGETFEWSGHLIDTPAEAKRALQAQTDMDRWQSTNSEYKAALEQYYAVAHATDNVGVVGGASKPKNGAKAAAWKVAEDAKARRGDWSLAMEWAFGKPKATEDEEARLRIRQDIPQGIPNTYVTGSPQVIAPPEGKGAPATVQPVSDSGTVGNGGLVYAAKSDPTISRVYDALGELDRSDERYREKRNAILNLNGVTEQHLTDYGKRNDSPLQMLETKLIELLVDPAYAALKVLTDAGIKDQKLFNKIWEQTTVTPEMLVAAVMGDPAYNGRGITPEMLWEVLDRNNRKTPTLQEWSRRDWTPGELSLQQQIDIRGAAIDRLAEQRKEMEGDARRAAGAELGKLVDEIKALSVKLDKLHEETKELKQKLDTAHSPNTLTMYEGTPQLLRDILENKPPKAAVPTTSGGGGGDGGGGGGGAPRQPQAARPQVAEQAFAAKRESFEPDKTESPMIEAYKRDWQRARIAKTRIRLENIIRALRAGLPIDEFVPRFGYGR